MLTGVPRLGHRAVFVPADSGVASTSFARAAFSRFRFQFRPVFVAADSRIASAARSRFSAGRSGV